MVRRLQEDADPSTVKDDGALVHQCDDGSLRALVRRRYAERGRTVWRGPSTVVRDLRSAAKNPPGGVNQKTGGIDHPGAS